MLMHRVLKYGSILVTDDSERLAMAGCGLTSALRQAAQIVRNHVDSLQEAKDTKV